MLIFFSVNAHRSNIIKIVSELLMFISNADHTHTQALKAARSHRDQFRSLVLEILYATKELGITPKTLETTVADRVELLLFENRFLDGPHTVMDFHYRLHLITNHPPREKVDHWISCIGLLS